MLAVLAILPLLASVCAGPITKRYTSAYIYSGRDGKCLSTIPRNGVGAAVFSTDCANAITWDINPGSGSVIVSGTNLALDAGTNPGNNGALKVWTSYPGLYQQTWYLTDDNRIAITGGNQCLDEGDNGIQTYQCTTGNTNQVFYIRGGNPPLTSSSSSASSTPSPSQSSTPPPTGGRQLHPNGDNSRCLTLFGAPGDGTPVVISACLLGSSTQSWTTANGAGLVRLTGTNYCLDAGSNPGDGIGLKVWTCYNGLFQQTWTYANNKISLADNQCVDNKDGQFNAVQTWTCYAGNSNQVFTS